jgi:glycerol-3-phosphate dehydrogenase (NAD(P)+)
MKNVAEGVPTTVAALRMAEELGVEMPIAQATYQVLFEGVAPKQAVAALMGRPPRSEWGGIS